MAKKKKLYNLILSASLVAIHLSEKGAPDKVCANQKRGAIRESPLQVCFLAAHLMKESTPPRVPLTRGGVDFYCISIKIEKIAKKYANPQKKVDKWTNCVL